MTTNHPANRKPRHWYHSRPWQTNTVLILTGFALLLITLDLIREFHHQIVGFHSVADISLWSAILYAAAALLILTQPINRATFGIILAFAIAFRLVTLLPAPQMSSDIYRYAWDGVVQHAHISPYRYVPADPALTFLRAPNQDLYDHINRRDYAKTIYPPAAQFLFFLITFLNPTVTFMKLAMILFEGLTMYALVKLLKDLGLPREQSLLYAWCPLLVWEFGSSGHLDSAAMAFLALALLFRYRRQHLLTGLFIAIAILIKIYPAAMLPALYIRSERKMPITVAAVIAFGYACYSSVGTGVFGFASGYAKEEGMQSGNRYFLLELAHQIPGLENLPSTVFLAFCALIAAALIYWCWRTCCLPLSDPRQSTLPTTQTTLFNLPPAANFLPPAAAIAFALMLLFAPHYPWYIAWLVPFFTLIPSLSLFAYISGVFYLFTTPLADGSTTKQFLLNKILYALVLIAFAIEASIRRWPIHRPIFFALEPTSPGPESKA